MHELQLQEILPPDTVHYLFGNLNSLVDFQRRFLIHLEEIAEKSGQEQNFGSLFSQLEDQFTVYEPYCSNYFSAQDLVKQEAPKLQKLANILNPVYELPSMLIKPVQRICKYPLLMQQLIKSTPQEWPHVAEMEEGLESVKRVTEKVNETQRKHENIQVVETLKRRLEEVRGSLIDSFGSLLLQEKLRMTSSDENDKEMHVFFFEKTVLICKETKDATKGKPAKSSMSIKKKRRASLQPKGLINIRKILGVQNRSESGSWTLAIEWRDREVDRLFFRFRNEELLKLWEGTLKRVMAPPKTTVSNTQLASMKSPTLPPTVPDSLRVEDEDNSVERHYDAEEDEAYQRARSNSLSAQLLNSITGRPKLPRNVNSENSYKPSRPYQSIPRSNSSTGTSLSQEYYYPASPPPSGPSSPTNSSRASQASSSSSIRQRDASPLVDIATKFMTADTATNAEEYRQLSRPPPPPHINRSQSHTVSSPFGSTQTPQHLYQPPSSRLRSQSSPNIHNKTPPATQWDDAPQLPISSRTLYQAPPSPLDSLKESNSYRTTMSSSTGSSLSRSSDMHVPHSPALLPGMLKIKINYNDGIYVVMSPLETTYPELMDKVEKKVRLIGNLQTNAVLRLRYEDEDGDLITINSDEDVQMAFESRGSVTAINLYVSA
jgi:cell division control protein 24